MCVKEKEKQQGAVPNGIKSETKDKNISMCWTFFLLIREMIKEQFFN